MNQTSPASDTDWTTVYWCAGFFVAGLVIGAVVLGPPYVKFKEKKKAKKPETPAKP